MINNIFYFDIETQRTPFISDPFNNKTFTYGDLINYAKSISSEKLNNVQTNDSILIITEDIYEIICHIIACWIKKIIPAVLSPNLMWEEYETFFMSLISKR